MSINNKKKKWYQSGLAFECRQCGACCAGPEEGYIWADADEIAAIAKFLNMTADDLKKKFMVRVGLRYSLIEKQPSKDCIFLQKKKDGTIGCDIYSVRPRQCRTWPFWTENLRSLNTWREAGRRCPGIDQNLWTDFEQIEKIRQGDLANRKPPVPITQAAWQWIRDNENNTQCLQAVEELYDQLDAAIAAAGAGQCDNCTQCCNFTQFGHQLFTTTLEMLYAYNGWQKNNLTPAAAARHLCPFSQKSGCSLRDYRPAGCRIVFCKGLDKNYQQDLTENTLQQLRRLHIDFNAVYLYTDLLQWINNTPHT